MLKRILSFSLIFTIILSFSSFFANADDSGKQLFKDKIVKDISEPIEIYEEVYYHYSDDDNIDWALIKFIYIRNPGIIYASLDDIVLVRASLGPFDFGICVYDVKNDEAYDICKAWDMDFADLHEDYNKLVDSDISLGVRIGDANYDGRISIQDANFIQRCLAGMDYISDYDTFTFAPNEKGDVIVSIADINRDGVVNINDVTDIQLKLVNAK